MSRRSITAVIDKNIGDIPEPCRDCGYWESSEPATVEEKTASNTRLKEEWYNHTLSNWGQCGMIVLQENQALAYCQYGPPIYFPQMRHYRFGPVSSDAVFLSCLYVPPQYQGRGLGKLLLSAVLKDLSKRGCRAVETITRRAPARNPSGWTEFYLTNGWQITKDSGSMVLLRVDIKSIVTWQENLETILESLYIPMKAPIKAPMPG